MTGEISIERRLEQMSKRLERAERANRVMKIWRFDWIRDAHRIRIRTVRFNGHGQESERPTAEVAAQAFDLENPGGQILATLTQVSGNPTWFSLMDLARPVLGVGLTSNAAGITVVDGNSILAGSGIARNTWGITNSGELSAESAARPLTPMASSGRAGAMLLTILPAAFSSMTLTGRSELASNTIRPPPFLMDFRPTMGAAIRCRFWAMF